MERGALFYLDNLCFLCKILKKFAHVAQSAEHILGKDEVAGSIPAMGFKIFQKGGRVYGKTEV